MKSYSILLILLSLLAHNLWGEVIKFEYDASGNRTKRIILLSSIRSAIIEETFDEEDVEEAPQVFTDMLAQSTIHIYPNPTKGLLKVEITGNGENKPVSLQVYDMNGRILLQESNIVSSFTIDLSNKPAGIYILRLTADNEKNEWKIIKE